jgi:hypothetical protein
VIFLGPTLPIELARTVLDATYLPPVAQGDVFRASKERPRAIGIIDGVFERIPAVWHKEILWALSQGIHVFGSASMGALRAAELAAFGMEGVGEIFRAFESGELEDDDEVAVAHADREEGFRPTSEAMVNIRATLRAARTAGVLDDDTVTTMQRLAKDLYYPERTYPALLASSREEGVHQEQIEGLRRFLVAGQVNQKREDALAMLRHMADRRSDLTEPRRVDFVFEHTDTWDQVINGIESRNDIDGAGEQFPSGLAEELRLRSPMNTLARRGAMLRALAEEGARRQGITVTRELSDSAQEAFRRTRGLQKREAVWDWIGENDLDEAGFGRLLESEAQLHWLETVYQGEGIRYLRSELIAMGLYPELRARAAHKQEVLSARGLADPALADADVGEIDLMRWYFEHRLGGPVPADLSTHLRESGVASEGELRREALREYLYLRFTTKT